MSRERARDLTLPGHWKLEGWGGRAGNREGLQKGEEPEAQALHLLPCVGEVWQRSPLPKRASGSTGELGSHLGLGSACHLSRCPPALPRVWWVEAVYFSYLTKNNSFEDLCGTSLVAQWLRICLSLQGTWVRFSVWEDSTCLGATTSMHRNYWARVLQRPHSPVREAHTPQ